MDPETQLLIVLYSPAKAQVVMVTGALVVGAVIVPKGEPFVHWLQPEWPLSKRVKIKRRMAPLRLRIKLAFCNFCFWGNFLTRSVTSGVNKFERDSI